MNAVTRLSTQGGRRYRAMGLGGWLRVLAVSGTTLVFSPLWALRANQYLGPKVTQ